MHVQLAEYVKASAEACRVYLYREQVPANVERLQLLDNSSTLREVLRGAVVIEYPILSVYLPPEGVQKCPGESTA